MPPNPAILHVAIPSPLGQGFDYLPPEGFDTTHALSPGMRVRVPFGRRQTVGLIVGIKDCSELPINKLKHAKEILDAHPLLPKDIMALGLWASRYYHHPMGEVFEGILPPPLRQGKPASVISETRWQLSPEGKTIPLENLKTAPRQKQLLTLLQNHAEGVSDTFIREQHKALRPTLTTLEKKGWINKILRPPAPPTYHPPQHPHPLNEEQQTAVQAVSSTLDHYRCHLLEGITGSGKTEVYLHLIDHVLQQGKQILVLVPEIGLTPQLMARFSQRFKQPLAVLHSGLNDTERTQAWLHAKRQLANIILGTRSAVFTPMANLGLIIIDEEHDISFKQQEGFRYSARDLAVHRAHQRNIPILMGSATPSFESLHNAISGRYHWLKLNQRAGHATSPRMRLMDVRSQRMKDCLSPQLLHEIGLRIARNEHVLIFINRRGYAPVLICHDCGWHAECPHCDAKMTLHMKIALLRCHHCDTQKSLPKQCPNCQHDELIPVGKGTERIDELLTQHFPDTHILRIDRDTTRRKGAMETLIAQVHENKDRGQILIGTQMLAKGHHFPHVTLVAIVDGDNGLCSNDFRATERMAQMIIQVAGRAGRADSAGEVLIQTHQPEHPLLCMLLQQGYHAFALHGLKEREETLLPPFSNLAMIRAEALNASLAMEVLGDVKEAARALNIQHVDILGPSPAPMIKRAGRFRAQLLFACETRPPLHKLLAQIVPWLRQNKAARKIRWSIDVDPQETY